MSDENHSGIQQRDPEEIARHESHLIGQIHYLIEMNQGLGDQLERLSKVTEIASLFRDQRITPDTFKLPGPKAPSDERQKEVWEHIERLLADLLDAMEVGEGAEAEDRKKATDVLSKELAEALDVARASGMKISPDWISDLRSRLIAAEQAIAFLNEQTHELDLLRREKDSIVDGAARLEQNIDDLWKSLNEKTTHIQRLESQLQRIWNSPPYRAFDWLRSFVRRKDS